MNIVDTPEFKKWFRNSKVVDDNGKPLKVYHGTMHNFDEFWSGSHFGDQEAANARLRNLSQNPPRFRNHRGVVIPVYLSIQNPIRIFDDGGLEDGYDLAKSVYRIGTISSDEEYKIFGTKDGVLAKRYLFKLLLDKGIDGIVYKNSIEGNTDSWIPFRPNQIKSIFNKEFSDSDKMLETFRDYYKQVEFQNAKNYKC